MRLFEKPIIKPFDLVAPEPPRPAYCPRCGVDLGKPTGRLGQCQCKQWLRPPPPDGLWCEAVSELEANMIRFGRGQ